MVDLSKFKWINESSVKESDGKISVYATPGSDFFCGGKGDEAFTPPTKINAPFYYTDVTGDFVLRVKVSHDFLYTYDSSSVLVMVDENNWAKICFEATDFDTHAAVSVVTKDGVSDDANGCNIEGNVAWLQIARAGNTFGFQYSVNGKDFYMMRFFKLNAEKTVKVGLLAQSPLGKGGERYYEDFTIENITVKNVRTGI